MWSQRVIGAAVAGALLVTVIGVALAGVGDSSPAAEGTPVASSGPSAPAAPVILTDCWMQATTGNVTMTTGQAQDLTTGAARALRRGRSAADFAGTVGNTLQVEADVARAVARGLLGATDAARLSCAVSRGAVEPEKIGPTGLTARAAQVRRAWTRVFGPLAAGGFARGGITRGHVDNSAHYEGRAIDVFFRPLDSVAQRQRGWVFAQWVVAHAEQFHVLSVIYSDHIWTSWASFLGFRDYQHPGGATTNAVLRHLEHVHVAVESGRPFRPR
jgi:hypothetical protein